jgi:hypothetical protein
MATIQAGAFHRRNFDGQAYESKTVDATAGGVSLTSGTYSTRRYALITVETAPVRFTVDGTAPVAATTGHLVNPGDIIKLDSNEDITAFRAIRETSTSGVLKVTYSELKLTE